MEGRSPAADGRGGVKMVIGDRVIWLHQPRGGYGYIFRIPVKILVSRGSRVKVEVTRKDGSRVERWVKRESLEAYHECT